MNEFCVSLFHQKYAVLSYLLAFARAVIFVLLLLIVFIIRLNLGVLKSQLP
jgi:hypothetical protein